MRKYAEINEVKDVIPSVKNLAITTALNAKLNEFKDKISNIINLATTTALIAAENEIPNASNVVKKPDYNTKTNEIGKKITDHDHDHDKYISTKV